MGYIQDLEIRTSICTACGACKKRKQPLVGQGLFGSPIMVVFDMPNSADDKKGELLQGRRGKQLIRALKMSKLNTDKLYYAPVMKCYPARATDKQKEIYYPAKCRPYIQEQIKIAKPAGIILVGQTALRWVLLEGSHDSADDFKKWIGRICTRQDTYGDIKFLTIEDPNDIGVGWEADKRHAALTSAIHTLRNYITAKIKRENVPLLEIHRVSTFSRTRIQMSSLLDENDIIDV